MPILILAVDDQTFPAHVRSGLLQAQKALPQWSFLERVRDLQAVER